ncbi:NAD/NADP octopine/nopaline dehydrogenase family protein [uncultured Tissierella sp.]|uniref:NAD/NADP octopine/nopaline dehydrogenase family protein n=2 Tax=Tissierella TaxID=41273 RepID=UPI0028038E04|nr:NAD/NADP octopine/nopaline dehydrogenase family protein [uncultured Tissierella sp.]MDU5081945.1 NAD/NADP octopine/nopaline dehydrogenase family protein [Bacillota bacterium]
MMGLNFSIIGAGNGGMAMAGYLAIMGYKVNLYNRTLENIIPLIKNPMISLTGEKKGTGVLNRVTNIMKDAIEGADIIMVTVPAIGHYQMAVEMAPYLKDGQIIVLNPGRTGGALEVYETIRKHKCDKDVIVAEAQTFIYACRTTSSNSAHIFQVKNEVTIAAIPSSKTNHVINLLKFAYPQFIQAKDVLETSINNYGAIFHPAPTLLNSGHIERGAPFEYYTEGITPSIGDFIEKMDQERMEIGKALQINTLSAKDWLYESYGARGKNLYETVQNNLAYKGLQAPKGLSIRYIYEDVPYSLIPMSSIARELGIKTPAINSIINISELITGKDFYAEGRTIERLGLKGLSVHEMHKIAQIGKIDKKDEEGVA